MNRTMPYVAAAVLGVAAISVTAQMKVIPKEFTSVTVTVEAIETVRLMSTRPPGSITFTGPNNWKYSSRVSDTAFLSKLEVGDKVDITWTMALLMAIE